MCHPGGRIAPRSFATTCGAGCAGACVTWNARRSRPSPRAGGPAFQARSTPTSCLFGCKKIEAIAGAESIRRLGRRDSPPPAPRRFEGSGGGRLRSAARLHRQDRNTASSPIRNCAAAPNRPHLPRSSECALSGRRGLRGGDGGRESLSPMPACAAYRRPESQSALRHRASSRIFLGPGSVRNGNIARQPAGLPFK